MINLKTLCNECAHKNVCRNVDYPETYTNRLTNCNMDYIEDTYDGDATFFAAADRFDLTVDISCNNFEKVVPTPRKAFS